MAELFDIIDNRKTIRKYDNYIPNEDEIKKIIDSARLAPSAINAQNWRFLAILNKDIKNEMADCVLKKYDEIMQKVDTETAQNISRYKGHSTFFKDAPLLIVCLEKAALSFMGGVLENAGYSALEIAKMRPDSYLLSMGGAVENMILSASALGFGSCWMVAPVLAEADFRKILNIQDDEKIVTLLTIGKPLGDNPNRMPKKTLDEVMEIIR